VDLAIDKKENDTFDSIANTQAEEPSFIFINIVHILCCIGAFVAILFVIVILRSVLKNYHFSPRNNRRRWQKNRKNRKRRRRTSRKNRDYDF